MSTNGAAVRFLRRVNAINPRDNAWALFERGEIDAPEFDVMFSRESRALGHEVRGAAVLPLLSGEIRPRMVTALVSCRRHFRVGCITNNMAGAGHGPGMAMDADRADKIAAIMDMFEVVLESAKIGLRKPDPKIYELMCQRLGVGVESCVFLDDLGINCKLAAQLGMIAIKVESEEQALLALEQATGLGLSSHRVS